MSEEKKEESNSQKGGIGIGVIILAIIIGIAASDKEAENAKEKATAASASAETVATPFDIEMITKAHKNTTSAQFAHFVSLAKGSYVAAKGKLLDVSEHKTYDGNYKAIVKVDSNIYIVLFVNADERLTLAKNERYYVSGQLTDVSSNLLEQVLAKLIHEDVKYMLEAELGAGTLIQPISEVSVSFETITKEGNRILENKLTASMPQSPEDL